MKIFDLLKKLVFTFQSKKLEKFHKIPKKISKILWIIPRFFLKCDDSNRAKVLNRKYNHDVLSEIKVKAY